MKLIYGIRFSMFYPFRGGDISRCLPPPELRSAYLGKVKKLGFDGLELGVDALGGLDTGEEEIRELRRELADAGLPCLAIRTKGGFHDPDVAAENEAHLHKGIQIADWIGAQIVDLTVSTKIKATRFGNGQGEADTKGSSREADPEDFEISAKGISLAADRAADLGISLSIEVHHASIVDNSRSAIRMLELIDRPNVGINPDVKNMVWAYDIPEEPWDEFMLALAPYANYWHCKNVKRVYLPQLSYSSYLRVPLAEGEINYRFALAAMLDAGYTGNLTVEGVQRGDPLYLDGRSAAYARSLIDELAGEPVAIRNGG